MSQLQPEIPDSPAKKYLEGKQVTAATASTAVLSDANAFESAYNWYLNSQEVTPENAFIASKIWVDKYALHDSDGICLESSPVDMWDRIANVLSEVEVKTNPTTSAASNGDWFDYFRQGLEDYTYSPQGSGLYSLGNTYVNASSSNCFVLPPPEDNLESIADTAKHMMQIYAARGGVGFNISNLRPKGAKTNNAARTSTGAVSFMDFYSYITGLIGQSGRRGALMESIFVDHPDVFEFIKEKRDLDKTNFFDELKEAGIDINDWQWSAIADRIKSTSHANVSVMITDKFMTAVKNDTDFELRFDFKDDNYPSIVKSVRARTIWDELMKGAWESAEPGILNWDQILRECPADQYSDLTEYEWVDPKTGETKKSLYSFATVGTNPCAEETLSAGDSCNLGIFNLMNFMISPYKPYAKFDWDGYRDAIKLGVRAQDNIKEWDLARLPLEVNRLSGYLGRRISVNNTALGDCIAAMGFKYDSDEGIKFAGEIYKFMANEAYKASALLAKEKGAFPAFNWEKHSKSPFIQRLDQSTLDLIKEHGLRNIGLLTQAPAGSMSILFRNCSSGIEPVYALSYVRSVKKPGSKDMEQHTIYHQAVADCIAAGGDTSVFVPAGEIHYSRRIEMQSVIQSHIDHSISSTINLPTSTTVEEVSKIYMDAYDKNLKGITIYRDKCRTGVLNKIGSDKVSAKTKHTIERPKTTSVDIHKMKYKERAWAILIGTVEGKPIEIFAGIEDDTPLPNKYHKAELVKKSRGHYSLTIYLSDDVEDIMKVNNVGARFPCPEGMALTRFVSLSLRNNVTISDIVEQLQKSSSSMFDYPAVLSRVLKQYISDDDAIAKEKSKGKTCPECSSELDFRRESGCIVEICPSCNYSNSKCG